MDNQKREKILKAYRGGMKNYIFFHGVLNWGISTAIIYRILITIINRGFSFSEIRSGLFSLETMTAMLIFGAGGFLWGLFMWKWIVKEAEKINYKPNKKNRKI